MVASLAASPVPARENPAAPGRPSRIVSLNLCADELVLRLADRGQVAAVTYLAGDPRGSTVAAQAAGVPVTRGLAEEIVALKPDLVIAGAFTTRTTVGLLKRIGFPPLELGVPANFDGVRAQIRQVAAAVGHPERGEAMVAELDATLARVVPASRLLRVLVLRPNAFTVSPGSLGDAIIRAAGLVNVAAQIGRDRTGSVPLEAAALADADLIVVDASEAGTPSLADALLHHPILERLRAQGRTVPIPNRLWTCPGPQVAKVVARLAAAARARTPMKTP
ncbi:ABC transporter substrate-binding protein [uncultured Methylobacterium sp.]|uniref:ABC transporter substrate-binding protein n=1 Tax=uncultured Methylobacterium sp. TaxID=157278 RepID=UPI0025993ED7|nr:ABC transporter substrate-binding protein [uncultured Methylobacterium sp.]